MTVGATGATSSTFTFDRTLFPNTHLNMMYQPELYSFLATSTNTTLTFASTTSPAGYGPVVDNIVVQETAPTGANCKKGGWQTMIVTSGNSFKNQGDCVSFFATGGKNLGAIAP
jgi:hypothetical protein